MARIGSLAIVAACVLVIRGEPPLSPGYRPPSIPLVVVSPYLSIWSGADHLYDAAPQHWSGGEMSLAGMIRIDGSCYRFMSKNGDLPSDIMTQTDVKVYPTQTIYTFEEAGVQLMLTFTTPALLNGTDSYLPMSMLTYDVKNVDNKPHTVQLYYDNTAQVVVSSDTENVNLERVTMPPGGLAMRMGTTSQNYLGQGSDRINWGYWYVNIIFEQSVQATMANATDTRAAFMSGKPLPTDDKAMPRPCNDNWPVIAVAWNLGSIAPGNSASRHLLVAYDEIYSIKYFGTSMEPLWKKKYGNFTGLLRGKSHEDIKQACDDFDSKVVGVLYKTGGQHYASFTSLAWRQAVGGTIAVWNSITNEQWMFAKEISSDGDVSTVDVLYPASPIFIWADPEAMKLMLLPILNYANNDTASYGLNVPYNLAWAPHHLGHWPVCDLLPSHQEQMPVEESGNMLLMIAGVVKQQGSLDFLSPYWKLLKIWADFIVASLPDPGNQLCTDDFEGPSPHNINLAAKGMVALGAYTYLLKKKGDTASATHYDVLNKQFIDYWITKGVSSSNDHFARQYDLPDSWSLKYNLLFQKILDLDLFPESVFQQELAYYMTKMEKYGIALDDRHTYAKVDWLMWVAALGSDKQFQAISDAVFAFTNATPTRVPFTDWYDVTTAVQRGFKARPVIGGLFAKLLTASTPPPHRQ